MTCLFFYILSLVHLSEELAKVFNIARGDQNLFLQGKPLETVLPYTANLQLLPETSPENPLILITKNTTYDFSKIFYRSVYNGVIVYSFDFSFGRFMGH